MKSAMTWLPARILAVITACTATTAARADAAAEFYKGKTIELIVGYGVGGGYDAYGRLVGRHLGNFIPGSPTVVVKNLDGAGGLRLANQLYVSLPQDGTVIGTIGRGVGFEPLFKTAAAKFDGTRFGWIGSANDEVSLCVSVASSGIATFDDLLKKELVISGTGASNESDQFPKVLNATLGTRMKLVSGYPTGNGVNLAFERGETQGRCGWSYSSIKTTHSQWLTYKRLNLLVQISFKKHPELPHVPLVMDLARNEKQRQIYQLIFARQVLGRPFLTTPNVPADRLAALRKAFMDTMNDKTFLADAQRMRAEITPVSGDEVQRIVNQIYAAPPEIAAKAGELMR